jgi:hypothetical protein
MTFAATRNRCSSTAALARRSASGFVVSTLAVVTVAVAPLALEAPRAAAAPESTVRAVTFPVHHDRAEDLRWTDTWGARRGGGRRHLGVDMLGEKMIPLVAARSGTVTWGRLDNRRGSLIRFRDDDGWEYQYIHLNNDSPGTDDGDATCTETFSARLCATVSNGVLQRGTRITEGEVIAYMGDSGNAEGSTAHLHFEVYRPTPRGPVSVNPTPVVDAALARLRSGASSSMAPPVAEPGEAGFVDHLWHRLYGRYPTAAERVDFGAAVEADGVWEAAAERVAPDSTAAALDRLYLAFFLRHPDTEGIRYWIRVRGSGQPSEHIAEWFAESEEFQLRYGDSGFGAFLDQLYRDVLGREPDPEGREYWLGLLETGQVSRGSIVVYFADGEEMIDLTGPRNEVVAISLLADGAAPSPDQIDTWRRLRSDTPVSDALASWYRGS